MANDLFGNAKLEEGKTMEVYTTYQPGDLYEINAKDKESSKAAHASFYEIFDSLMVKIKSRRYLRFYGFSPLSRYYDLEMAALDGET